MTVVVFFYKRIFAWNFLSHSKAIFAAEPSGYQVRKTMENTHSFLFTQLIPFTLKSGKPVVRIGEYYSNATMHVYNLNVPSSVLCIQLRMIRAEFMDRSRTGGRGNYTLPLLQLLAGLFSPTSNQLVSPCTAISVNVNQLTPCPDLLLEKNC